MNETMIDLETMGTSVGSVILSVGAVVFDEDKIVAEFYRKISKDLMIGDGFDVSTETMAWWENQSEEARTEAFSGKDKPSDVFLDLKEFILVNVGYSRVWSHGATFDISMVEHCFEEYGVNIPWKFWAIRDTRTLFDLSGIHPDRTKGTHHNALDDAKNQAEAVIKSVKLLGGYRV